VWSNFVNTSYETYNIDANYYLTAPSLSWDAFLKYSNCEIQLLTDYDMHLFMEQGIRGGISQISHRYAEANNKYMSNYNKDIDDKYVFRCK